MSGHSHWAKVKRGKAVTDARRGRLWGKLARGYGLEAVDRRSDARAGRTPVADDVRALLQKVSTEGGTESYPSPGLGRDVRIETDAASGAALVVGGEVVHCAVFGSEEPA